MDVLHHITPQLQVCGKEIQLLLNCDPHHYFKHLIVAVWLNFILHQVRANILSFVVYLQVLLGTAL